MVPFGVTRGLKGVRLPGRLAGRGACAPKSGAPESQPLLIVSTRKAVGLQQRGVPLMRS